MKEIEIFTDGACSGNPGPGGWAAILVYKTTRREIFGAAENTTNNRMEMAAIIESLRALKEPCAVTLHSDSRYLVDGTTAWLEGWRRKGWRRSAKTPLKNADLWREIHAQKSRHALRCLWVKGHAGHPENTRCDLLARDAIEKLICKNITPAAAYDLPSARNNGETFALEMEG